MPSYYIQDIDEPQVHNTTVSESDMSDYYFASETKFGQLPGIRNESWFGNLKALYTFNTANSGKSQDYSGNGNHGTDTSVTKSISEGSAEFNGSTSQSIVLDDADFRFSSDFTAACWVKGDDVSGTESMISWDQGGGATFWFLKKSDANGFIRVNDGSTDVSVTAGTLTTDWNHIAMVAREGISLDLYINGALIATNALGSFDFTGLDGGLTLGKNRNGGSQQLDGKLDNCMVFDTALTSNQVYNLYNDYPHGGQ